jgi:hypothetical protein
MPLKVEINLPQRQTTRTLSAKKNIHKNVHERKWEIFEEKKNLQVSKKQNENAHFDIR